MQKQQSKPIQSLSFEQLFQMAEQKYDEFDYEEAQYFYQIAYNKNPFNEAVVMCYANVLKQNDKSKEAKKILQKSIKEFPHGTYKRYFQLGEIYQGVEAIKSFQKGIQEAHNHLKNPFKSVTPSDQIKRDVSQAYASIAQICMTDLIDQPQAQAKCVEALQKGIKTDPKCMDAHLQMANYQLFKQNFDVARSELDIILAGVKAKQQQYDNDLILQTSKYYIELDQFCKSSELLQTIHEQESNQSQVVYLLAFCAFKLQQYDLCEDFIEQYKDGQKDIKDEQVEEAMNQLIVELSKIKAQNKGSLQGEGMEETGQHKQEDLQNEDDWMDVEDEN